MTDEYHLKEVEEMRGETVSKDRTQDTSELFEDTTLPNPNNAVNTGNWRIKSSVTLSSATFLEKTEKKIFVAKPIPRPIREAKKAVEGTVEKTANSAGEMFPELKNITAEEVDEALLRMRRRDY